MTVPAPAVYFPALDKCFGGEASLLYARVYLLQIIRENTLTARPDHGRQLVEHLTKAHHCHN